MARRIHGLTRGSGARRTNTWFFLTVLDTALAAGAKVLLGSFNAAALALRPFTIVRSRFLLKYGSDQLAISETPQASIGMIVVSDQAVAAGVASLPGPTTDADAPWFVHEGAIDEFLFGDATGFQGDAGFTKEVDSKSMRKVGSNEDLAIVAEQRATFGANVALQGRMLVKLH